MKRSLMDHATVLDRAALAVSPTWGLRRIHARAAAYAYLAASPTLRTPLPWKPYGKASADGALAPSLRALIDRSRSLSDNHPAARAAIDAGAGILVGTGIAIEPDSGIAENDELYADLFETWATTAGIDGSTLWEMQTRACIEWKEAGGFVWRWVIDRDRTAAGMLPDCLMELSVDWLSEDPVAPIDAGHGFVHGVELDRFGRPTHYHLRHPDGGSPIRALGGGAVLPTDVRDERVPASEIIHGYRRRRAAQHVGEPELAPAAIWLWNGHSLIDAELKSAVVGASPALLVKTRKGGTSIHDLGESAAPTAERPNPLPALGSTMPAGGGVAGLYPDEDVQVVANTRPSQQIMPFMKAIWGVVAGSLRIGRRMIDRDYSDATFSSLRADEADTQRQALPEQQVLGRFVATMPYRRVLPLLAALAGRPLPKAAALRERALRHDLMPDGTPYVNPVDDIRASVDAIAAGLSCHSDEASKRGKNYRRLWRQLAKEKAEREKLDLVFDLSATNAPAPASTLGDPAPAAATPAKDAP